jgi:hypothetical protein
MKAFERKQERFPMSTEIIVFIVIAVCLLVLKLLLARDRDYCIIEPRPFDEEAAKRLAQELSEELSARAQKSSSSDNKGESLLVEFLRSEKEKEDRRVEAGRDKEERDFKLNRTILRWRITISSILLVIGCYFAFGPMLKDNLEASGIFKVIIGAIIGQLLPSQSDIKSAIRPH